MTSDPHTEPRTPAMCECEGYTCRHAPTPPTPGADATPPLDQPEATGKKWATLNIPNPYRPDTTAWVAFEQGQLAAIDALRAEQEGAEG